jgi:hypothetical protein
MDDKIPSPAQLSRNCLESIRSTLSTLSTSASPPQNNLPQIPPRPRKGIPRHTSAGYPSSCLARHPAPTGPRTCLRTFGPPQGPESGSGSGPSGGKPQCGGGTFRARAARLAVVPKEPGARFPSHPNELSAHHEISPASPTNPTNPANPASPTNPAPPVRPPRRPIGMLLGLIRLRTPWGPAGAWVRAHPLHQPRDYIPQGFEPLPPLFWKTARVVVYPPQ